MKKFMEVRLARGLSSAELAKRSGVNLSTVRHANQGYEPATHRVRHALASALGTTEAELWPDDPTV